MFFYGAPPPSYSSGGNSSGGGIGINPFAIVGIGLSLWQGISGAQEEREQANIQKDSIGREMELLRKQKTELTKQYGVRGEQLSDKFGNKANTLLNRLSTNMLQGQEQKRDVQARTGLQYSGTVNRKSEIDSNALRSTNKLGQKSLFDQYKSDELELGFSETREQGQLDVRLSGLEGQYKAADALSNERFLGIF